MHVTGYTVSDALMDRMKKEKIYNFRITFKGVLDTEWGGAAQIGSNCSLRCISAHQSHDGMTLSRW